jgi:hypothetical protein
LRIVARLAQGECLHKESEFNASFVIHILTSIDFKVLSNTVTNEVRLLSDRSSVSNLSLTAQLKLKGFPDKIPEGKLSLEEHGTFLRAVHDALVDVRSPLRPLRARRLFFSC